MWLINVTGVSARLSHNFSVLQLSPFFLLVCKVAESRAKSVSNILGSFRMRIMEEGDGWLQMTKFDSIGRSRSFRREGVRVTLMHVVTATILHIFTGRTCSSIVLQLADQWACCYTT